MKRLNNAGVAYEISLIYGLPRQTVASFAGEAAYMAAVAAAQGCAVHWALPLWQ